MGVTDEDMNFDAVPSVPKKRLGGACIRFFRTAPYFNLLAFIQSVARQDFRPSIRTRDLHFNWLSRLSSPLYRGRCTI